MLRLLFTLLVVLPLCLASSAHARRTQQNLQVGLMASIFGKLDQDKAVGQVRILAEEVERKTNTRADFKIVPDLESLVKDLQANRLQMAMLPGIEYAWVRGQLPDAKPVLIAVSDKTTLQTMVLVNATSKVNSLAELKGKPFVLADVTPNHVHFFLQRELEGEPGNYFAMQPTKTAESALEAVIDGKAEATAVSESVWALLEEFKPARARRLKVLVQSPQFPAPVLIARNPAQENRQLVDKFVNAMLRVHESDAGRQTLTLWRLRQFQSVPADYPNILESIAGKYPQKPAP